MNLKSYSIALVLVSSLYGQAFGPSENGVSLEGTRLTYYPRPAFAQCSTDCANNGNCKGFTWIAAGTYKAADPAMCYLMSAVTGRVPAKGHTSAVKGAPAPPPVAGTETGVALTGTNLRYYPSPGVAQCQADCVKEVNCKGFSLIAAGTYKPSDPPMCYLLSAVTGKSQAKGYTSGVKQAGTPPPPPPPSGVDIKGMWQWHSCNDEYAMLIGFSSLDGGGNFTGGFENGNGEIKNGTLRGDRIEFDRVSGWTQHYSGQMVNAGGKLKIVNGAWSGAYIEKCAGRANWHAEKQ